MFDTLTDLFLWLWALAVALPGRVLHVLTYAVHHPAVLAVAAVAGLAAAVSLYIHVRSWRKP